MQEGGCGQLRSLGADHAHGLVHPGRGLLEVAGPELGLGQFGDGGQLQPDRQVHPPEQIFANRRRLLVVANGALGLSEIQEQPGRGLISSQLHQGLQVTDGGTGRALAERLSTGLSQDLAGFGPDQASRHGVFGHLGGRRPPGQQHPEGRLVQVGVLGRHLVVDGQADQVVTECGPAVFGLDHQAGADQGLQGAGGFGWPESGHVGGHLGAKTGSQHTRGPQIGLGGRAHPGET